ncbi:hypothetical protein [uncultured Bacteroides sp.]|uniref:hypothetical protein n=1 Tax=uncultured Bacteroides sp. TaxID=162156 RepID=UPI002AABF866|nr:hypothetical protein [uncultured Bacteroides sp.]
MKSKIMLAAPYFKERCKAISVNNILVDVKYNTYSIMDKEINNYITKRYERWLDYSKFQCTRKGILDEAIDVLNEVLLSLLEKDESKLIEMYNKKKNGYTELDFFILRMINLNANSPTSPYQNKYKYIPADDNVDYTCLEILDAQEDQIDSAGIVLEKMHLLRFIFDRLELSQTERAIFEYKFFEEYTIADLTVFDAQKKLYDAYNYVEDLIKKVMQRLGVGSKVKEHPIGRTPAKWMKETVQIFFDRIESNPNEKSELIELVSRIKDIN